MEYYVQKKSKTKGKEIHSLEGLKKKHYKVAAYVRVSTFEEEQEKSYYSSYSYFYKMINSNENWEFVDIYTDMGISGTYTNKRQGFMQMIEDAINGKIDLILTKSISRFARNTADVLKWIKLLKEHHVGIYFQEENINTLSQIGDFVITILASVAQQESENLSEHVLLALRYRMLHGVLIGRHTGFGYVYSPKTKQITYTEEEKEIIKEIFKLFLKGHNYSEIRTIVNRKYSGYTQKIPQRMRRILVNETYAGDLLQGKEFVSSPLTHKRMTNKGQRDMYLLENHHEALIDRETFNKVQEKIKENDEKNKIASYQSYDFSKRCICGYCGHIAIHDVARDKVCWFCGNGRHRNGCNESKAISEDLLKEIFVEVTKKLKERLKINNQNDLLNKLKYLKNILLLYSFKEEFDADFFKALVNYIIIGTNETKDKYSPFSLRFILKTKNKILDEDYKKEAELLTYNYKQIFNFDYKTMFHYCTTGKKSTKVIINKIPVSVEFNPKEAIYDN